MHYLKLQLGGLITEYGMMSVAAMGFYQISNRDIGSNKDKVINDTKDVVENIVLLHDDGSLK